MFAGLLTLFWIIIKIVAIIVGLVGIVLYLTYFERKVIGYMHVRIGPNRLAHVVCCSLLQTHSNF